MYKDLIWMELNYSHIRNGKTCYLDDFINDLAYYYNDICIFVKKILKKPIKKRIIKYME